MRKQTQLVIKQHSLIGILFLIGFLLFSPALFAAEAGKFLFVFGDVFIELDGNKQKAKKGMPVLEGAKIISAKNGKAQLRLKDGGFIAVRPNTELIVDEHAFKQEGRENKSVTTLIKGTFRTISGAIAKDNPDKVIVKTPVATIGIRGTDHEPALIPPGAGGLKPGLYDKVNAGVTVISNSAGQIVIGPAQVGYVGQLNEVPVKLEVIPAFYQQPNEALAVESEQDEEGSDAEESSGTNDSTEDNDSGVSDSQSTDENADEPAGGSETETAPAQQDSGSGESSSSTESTIAATSSGGELVTVIQAADSSGNTIDATNQTVTDASGNTIPVSIATVSFEVGAASFIQYDDQAGGGPSSTDYDFKMIEDAKVVDTLRQQILRNTSGQVIGAVESDGTEHYVTGNVSEVEPIVADGAVKYGVLKADNLFDGGSNNALYPLGNRYWSWITGPGYVPSTFTGTMYLNSIQGSGVAYGGTLDGTWAPLSGLNGTIGLDLNSSLITDMTLNVGVSVDQWEFKAINLALDPYGQFSEQTVNASSNLTVLYNNAAADTFGAIAGSVTGSADGVLMTFSAKHVTSSTSTVGQGVTGAAVFRP